MVEKNRLSEFVLLLDRYGFRFPSYTNAGYISTNGVIGYIGDMIISIYYNPDGYCVKMGDSVEHRVLIDIYELNYHDVYEIIVEMFKNRGREYWHGRVKYWQTRAHNMAIEKALDWL